MKTAIGYAILFLLLLATCKFAIAMGPENCVAVNVTGTAEIGPFDVSQFSAPWKFEIGDLGCASVGSANFKQYGPCLDNASPCHRGPGFFPVAVATPTVTSSNRVVTGAGPIDGFSVVPVAVPTATTCVGGSNDQVACSADSACPSGKCGPCRTVATFCGVNPGVPAAREQ